MRSLFLLPLLLGFSMPAIAESKIYKINVSAKDYRNYILNGTDRNGYINGNDPTITLNKGDTIIFTIDASRHPFYLKTEFSRGSVKQIKTGKLSGSQGTQVGKLSWDTSGVSAGIYYYVCSPHAPFGMGGKIVVK